MLLLAEGVGSTDREIVLSNAATRQQPLHVGSVKTLSQWIIPCQSTRSLLAMGTLRVFGASNGLDGVSRGGWERAKIGNGRKRWVS